jgi:ZIP family zinc transporter
VFLINYYQLLLLGAIAGFTIFLGFPIVMMRVSQNKMGFLNSIAIGILVFIVIDVFAHSWDAVTTSVINSLSGKSPMFEGITTITTLFIGVALGLVGLALYERKYMKDTAKTETVFEKSIAGKNSHEIERYRLAIMIAIGIGAHNFSEGLAIGQSYASGAISLALLLIIGFGAHNATEGLGIVSPLTGSEKKPSWQFLFKLGLISGFPTFLGTIIGSLWVSPLLYVLFLSFAGGALIFVILLMCGVALKQTSNTTIMTGIFIGLMAGLLTDLIITVGGA